MNFTLIVCTYKRPQALLKLLASVQQQEVYPDQIIIVDGSPDDTTAEAIVDTAVVNLEYYHVSPQDRGLTRQRNFGIDKVQQGVEVVCFLDDDIILKPSYFRELLNTYSIYPEALGVGGYIIEKRQCKFVGHSHTPSIREYCFDGWVRVDDTRFIARKILGLDSNVPPGYSPTYSHGRSVSFMPPSGNIYPTELVMGGVSSWRRSVFEDFSFSRYFEGYGLYEDADFSLRVAKTGLLYINTSANLYHYHEASGRPNQFDYGKMVVRNGWYVWRVKNPGPSLSARMKWNLITLLLTVIRFSNIFTTSKRKQALTEALGRCAGWISLVADKPRDIHESI